MPPFCGDRIGCEVELGVGCEVRTAILWDDSPSATAQGLTRRTGSTLPEIGESPVARTAGERECFSLDNSFLRSRRGLRSPRLPRPLAAERWCSADRERSPLHDGA